MFVGTECGQHIVIRIFITTICMVECTPVGVHRFLSRKQMSPDLIQCSYCRGPLVETHVNQLLQRRQTYLASEICNMRCTLAMLQKYTPSRAASAGVDTTQITLHIIHSRYKRVHNAHFTPSHPMGPAHHHRS